MMFQDAAALALPSSLPSCQAEVPTGGHGVWATGKPPQGHVNGSPQDTQRHAICKKDRLGQSWFSGFNVWMKQISDSHELKFWSFLTPAQTTRLTYLSHDNRGGYIPPLSSVSQQRGVASGGEKLAIAEAQQVEFVDCVLSLSPVHITDRGYLISVINSSPATLRKRRRLNKLSPRSY